MLKQEKVEKLVEEIIDKQTSKLIGLLVDRKYYNHYLEKNDIDKMRDELKDIEESLSKARFDRASMIKNKDINNDAYDNMEKEIERLDSLKQDLGQKINSYNQMASENMKNEILIPEVKEYIKLVKNLGSSEDEVKKIVNEILE